MSRGRRLSRTLRDYLGRGRKRRAWRCPCCGVGHDDLPDGHVLRGRLDGTAYCTTANPRQMGGSHG
jgi:hypothetical protein